jgi:hypothetical protein
MKIEGDGDISFGSSTSGSRIGMNGDISGQSRSIKLRSSYSGDETNAGTIAYRPTWDSSVLAIVGAGDTSSNRKVRIWDQLCLGTDCRSSWPSGIGGSGTTNYLAKFTSSNTIGDSRIYDSGSGAVTIDGDVDVNGWSLELAGADFVLGTNDGRWKGSATNQRALVHDGTATSGDYLVINYAGDFEGGTRIDGITRMRPPLAYKSSTTVSGPMSDGSWSDDPMGSVSISIPGPSTLWIIYRGRNWVNASGGSCAHAFGYSRIKVDTTEYGESMFGWETSTTEGNTVERGFVSSLLIDVSCASYPCTKTITGRYYWKSRNCCPPLIGSCSMTSHLAGRNLFVMAFRN